MTTNYERITNMSVEEMAEIFDVIAENDICLNPTAFGCVEECRFYYFCETPTRKAKEWLESEVSNDGYRE